MARVVGVSTLAGGSKNDLYKELVETAGDAVNFHEYPMSGNDLVICRNSGASPHTLTVQGSATTQGRAVDDVKAVPAGETWIFGPYTHEGWAQDGETIVGAVLQLDPDHAELFLSVVRLQQ